LVRLFRFRQQTVFTFLVGPKKFFWSGANLALVTKSIFRWTEIGLEGSPELSVRNAESLNEYVLQVKPGFSYSLCCAVIWLYYANGVV